jgi:hypothetical protein
MLWLLLGTIVPMERVVVGIWVMEIKEIYWLLHVRLASTREKSCRPELGSKQLQRLSKDDRIVTFAVTVVTYTCPPLWFLHRHFAQQASLQAPDCLSGSLQMSKLHHASLPTLPHPPPNGLHHTLVIWGKAKHTNTMYKSCTDTRKLITSHSSKISDCHSSSGVEAIWWQLHQQETLSRYIIHTYVDLLLHVKKSNSRNIISKQKEEEEEESKCAPNPRKQIKDWRMGFNSHKTFAVWLSTEISMHMVDCEKHILQSSKRVYIDEKILLRKLSSIKTKIKEKKSIRRSLSASPWMNGHDIISPISLPPTFHHLETQREASKQHEGRVV